LGSVLHPDGMRALRAMPIHQDKSHTARCRPDGNAVLCSSIAVPLERVVDFCHHKLLALLSANKKKGQKKKKQFNLLNQQIKQQEYQKTPNQLNKQ
jgi:hypothetical protein